MEGVTKEKLSRGRVEKYLALKFLLSSEQDEEPWKNVHHAESIQKWSLPGQDKPLLPSTNEYELLFLQKKYVVKINSSFPTVFAQFFVCWV